MLKTAYLIVGLALLAWTCSAQLKCEPQKGFFMSYNAMSKRDTLPDMFGLINQKIPKYNCSWTEFKSAKNYTITNMHPQMYYNEHHQLETYVSKQYIIIDFTHVNVTLGDIEFAFKLDYEISIHGSTDIKKTGMARGRALLDQNSYFTK